MTTFEPPLPRDNDPTPLVGESALDIALRPKALADFVGQPLVVDNLRIAMTAAKLRGEPVDHVLLSGLPGLGKTTLAELVAREMGAGFRATSAPALERPADLAGILTGLSAGDVLFVDEIHRLPSTVEEYLYGAMEDFVIDIVLDQGARARTVRLDVKPFTLVGATTREGLLAPPFRARFGLIERLEPYANDDLARIAIRSCGLLKVDVDAAAAAAVASRSRGTPRVVNRFLRRLRDLAQVEGRTRIDRELVDRGLTRLGVDDRGLLAVDRLILSTLARAGGEPVGVKTLAITLGEDERTVEDVYEPHLIREGFILKTPRGRILTPDGEKAAGVPARPDDRLPFGAG